MCSLQTQYGYFLSHAYCLHISGFKFLILFHIRVNTQKHEAKVFNLGRAQFAHFSVQY